MTASQLATADLAVLTEADRQAGARLAAVGDTEQLGAVEAGGMFRLLAHEVPCVELHEIRWFDAAREADASVRLRAGDFTAYASYDRHGKMRAASQQTAMDRAVGMWVADHLQGKNVPARAIWWPRVCLQRPVISAPLMLVRSAEGASPLPGGGRAGSCYVGNGG